ncbi:MAG: hypothetical protein P8P27_02850 [Flavobacteriaceae bacterium]|nr:hypothetical protein [Flavobacteriaceae bacterium]
MKIIKLLIGLALAIGALSCEDVCDAKVYGTNDDGSTYEECIVYEDYD